MSTSSSSSSRAAPPGLLGLAKIEDALAFLLAGPRVDLRTAGDLSRYSRDEVLRQAQEQYAA